MAQDELIERLEQQYVDGVRFVAEGVSEETPEGYGVSVRHRGQPVRFHTNLGASRVGPIVVDESSLTIEEESSMYHIYMRTAQENTLRDIRVLGSNNILDLRNVPNRPRETNILITGDENELVGSRYSEEVTIQHSYGNTGDLRDGNDLLTIDTGLAPRQNVAVSGVRYSGGEGDDTALILGNLSRPNSPDLDEQMGELFYRRDPEGGLAFYVLRDNGVMTRIATLSDFETIEIQVGGTTDSPLTQRINVVDLERRIGESTNPNLARFEAIDISPAGVNLDTQFAPHVLIPNRARTTTGREIDA